MKKAAAFLTICFLLVCLCASAQEKATDSLPPFKKYPTLPAFNLLELDSATTFNTFNIPEGRPTILMFYSPDCDHCQMVTDTMVHHMNELKDVQIYMLTIMTIAESKKFAAKLHLEKYKNIRLFKDPDFFFPRFYKASYVPYIVVYDRHKKLVAAYEGGAKIAELINAVSKK
jgi:thiol-disulfide isomerase/thioredoxin